MKNIGSIRTVFASLLFIGLFIGACLPAAALNLHSVHFPERRDVQLDFSLAPGAPDATVKASVLYKDGQAKIDVTFDSMKPAVLYGGDVTCYVIWAVTESGSTENLGELLVREPRGKLTYATAKKQFALLITAEPYFLVNRPADLVVFHSAPYETKKEKSVAFAFDGFAPAPDHAMQSIRQISWDSDEPLEMLQARKAFEVATQRGASAHAGQIYGEAGEALARAEELASKSKRSRELYDLARRSVALSNEAINLTMHRIESVELEQQLARRRAEIESIERRAEEAEALAAQARAAAQASREEQTLLNAEIDTLVRSRKRLESDLSTMEERTQQLAIEKKQLRNQLESALSHVADTRQSARGLVVNLPDILFDVNQATLKQQTEIVLAKLAGILLILPDLTATVEGHTDATGGEEYNLKLSEQRASAVYAFLELQGIDPSRLTAEGFGMSRPVAENKTNEGRAKNRRVEIVIGDGSTAALPGASRNRPNS